MKKGALMNLAFDNRYRQELPGDPETEVYPRQAHRAFWSAVDPTPVKAPKLLAYLAEVASLLGLTEEEITSHQFVEVFSGNRLLDGTEPYAACYGFLQPGVMMRNWAG